MSSHQYRSWAEKIAMSRDQPSSEASSLALCTWLEANPVASAGTLLPAVDELQGPYYDTEVCNFWKSSTRWPGTCWGRFALFAERIDRARTIYMAKRIVAGLWPESPTQRTTSTNFPDTLARLGKLARHD
jgi:hypothetical protein